MFLLTFLRNSSTTIATRHVDTGEKQVQHVHDDERDEPMQDKQLLKTNPDQQMFPLHHQILMLFQTLQTTNPQLK